MSKLTFEERMMLSIAGDKRVYAQLLTEISKIIRSYLYKRLNSDTDVEDVLQEVLCSIHKARHTYDGNRPLKPWIFTIAKYRLNDFLRKAYKDILRESVDFSAIEEFIPDNVTKGTEPNELLDILNQLPERDRIIITMMKIEGYTAKEVAKKLEMNVSAVKVSAHRAYKKLKVIIEAESE